MIKQILFMTAAVAGAIILGSCSNDNESSATSGDTAQQVAVSFGTRSGSNTDFTENDMVKIFVRYYSANDDSYNSTTVFTLGSDGTWLSEDNKDYLEVNFPVVFTAVYPGTDDAAFTAFSLPNVTSNTADQSTVALLHAADYMTYTWHITGLPDCLNFEMEHHLCKVTVTISEYGEKFTNMIPTITGEKIISKGSGIAYTNSAWTATGSQTDITPLKTADATKGLHVYEAIITPGTYAAGDNLMTLSVNGSTLEVPFTEESTFASGMYYHYTLKVGRDYVTLTQTSAISGWGTEDDETEL